MITTNLYLGDCLEIMSDMMTGSGSTGVACIQTGRNFLGVEIDQGYFAIAQNRIEKARAELLAVERKEAL